MNLYNTLTPPNRKTDNTKEGGCGVGEGWLHVTDIEVQEVYARLIETCHAHYYLKGVHEKLYKKVKKF